MPGPGPAPGRSPRWAKAFARPKRTTPATKAPTVIQAPLRFMADLPWGLLLGKSKESIMWSVHMTLHARGDPAHRCHRLAVRRYRPIDPTPIRSGRRGVHFIH